MEGIFKGNMTVSVDAWPTKSEGSSERDNRDGGGIAKVSDGSVRGGGVGEAVMIKVGITLVVVVAATTVAASQEWIIIISL